MNTGFADFHLHLLPGVDDGASTLAETLSIARGLERLGFSTLACTPHQKEGSINPSLPSVQEVYAVVVEEVQERLPHVRLLLGAENFYDSQLSRRLDEHTVPTFAASDVFLVEFPPSIDEKTFRTALFRILTEGYIPLLAHVERYENINAATLSAVADEVILQANLTSFVKEAQNAANHARAVQYVEKGLIRIFATDMHSVHMLPRVEEAMHWVDTHLGRDVLVQCLQEFPDELLREWIRLPE